MESAPMPRLAWKWILEKLVDLPDFGVAFFNEVITRHVTDIEEPHCRPLLERVALRNLEEMVVTNQIDSGAIPLLKALTGQDLGLGTTIGSSVKQRFNKELVLRVQTEVVLSVLRKDVDDGEKDWAFYEAELERVFGDSDEDSRLLDRKRELSALLKPKNQKKANVAAYFDKYSLKKLRNDLDSFIDEKRESFKTMFLDQLSRDFLDANGLPFVEGVEQSTKVEATGKQDHMGLNPIVKETGDQIVVLGTAIISGKERLKRKLLPARDDIGDDKSDEAEAGSAEMKKPRNVPSTSIVKSLLHQDKSISTERAKTSPRDPSRTDKCVVVSDVDSDAETQIVKRLSTDDEDSVTVKGDGDKHKKRVAQSLSENGSDRGHPQNIVEAEVVRKEAIIVQSEQMMLVDRNEASSGLPKVKVSQQEKFVTKKAFIPPDSQDLYELDFLEVGIDGKEESCHMCGMDGNLICCDGCPISMHFDCIKGLGGLRLPSVEEDWYCPVCVSLRAAREAAEAEKAAAVAKEELKAFKMKSQKRHGFPEGDSNRQEKAGNQSRLRISSMQRGENNRALKQRSDDEPKQGQQDIDASNASLVPTVLRKALNQLNQRDSDHSLPEDTPESNRVISSGQGVDGKSDERALRVIELLMNVSPKSLVKNGAGSIRDGSAKSVSSNEDVERNPHKTQPAHDQDVSRRDLFAASTSGQAIRERERFARSSKKKVPEVDRDEESAEQTEAGVPEPTSGAGGRREMEDDMDDEDLDEDRSEDRKRVVVLSDRQRIPGLRRKHLPWTMQEEHALKEGVKRYSYNGLWGFQWKRILEFGQGRFHPTRTDVDLKDKWRNLIKGLT